MALTCSVREHGDSLPEDLPGLQRNLDHVRALIEQLIHGLAAASSVVLMVLPLPPNTAMG